MKKDIYKFFVISVVILLFIFTTAYSASATIHRVFTCRGPADKNCGDYEDSKDDCISNGCTWCDCDWDHQGTDTCGAWCGEGGIFCGNTLARRDCPSATRCSIWTCSWEGRNECDCAGIQASGPSWQGTASHTHGDGGCLMDETGCCGTDTCWAACGLVCRKPPNIGCTCSASTSCCGSCCGGVCITSQCWSGPCCTTGTLSGCYESTSEVCDTWNEYRCVGGDSNGCGATLERQTNNQYCSGNSAQCTGSTVYGLWATDQTCAFTETCSAGLPGCETDPVLCPEDTDPPITTITLSGTQGLSGWYVTNVDVTLTCSDGQGGSGCSATRYCVDTSNTCSPSTVYSSQFTISSEGTRYVRYYSTDNAGNQESTRSTRVRIDKTSPSVSVTGAPASWQNTDATASVSCSDPGGSGCNAGSYRLVTYASNPGSCPSTYSSYTLASPQTISSHRWVCAAARDNVGNTGFSSPVEFRVDKTNPTASITGESTTWVNSDDITLSCSDSGGSGCISTKWYYFDSDGTCSGSKSSYTFSTTSSVITVNTNRNDWLCLWVEDSAGNYDTDVSSRLMVDTTDPSTSISLSGTMGWNNWYTTDVQVTLTCSDSGGSDCDFTRYCIDSTNTCSPSISYSSTFAVSPEGTNYVRYRSTDNAGNQESTKSTQVLIDKTNPTFVSYSVSGCDYENATTQTCWVNPGTITTHEIQHTDSVSTPSRQYIAFASGCAPNNCGCNNIELCASGNEIKSSVDVDTGVTTSHMWNDDYLTIQSVSCSGICTGASVDEIWTVNTGNNQKSYNVYAFLYDEAGRETGYIDTGWQYLIGVVGMTASIFINNDDTYTNSNSVTLNLAYSDPVGPGIKDCRYRNEGGSWTTWEACAPTKAWTLTAGDGTKTVYYEVRNNLLSVIQDSDSIILESTPPSTSISLSGTMGWNNWYTTNVQVTLTCSDPGGSGCADTTYCVDTTDTCSPSIPYSSSFIVSDEGTNYVRYRSTDNAGNQESTQSTQVLIDKTNPTFVSYSVSGCDYEDTSNQICWVNSGTTTHRIQHTDSVSTPSRQYITFTSGCAPESCGCNWGEICASGNEIKSSVDVDTGIITDNMWNYNYLTIQSVSCSGSCTGASVDEIWTVDTGSSQKSYSVYAFLYDEAGRGTGYINTGWQYTNDTTPPVSLVSTLPFYTQSNAFDLYWGGSDSGSGIDCYKIEFRYNDTVNLTSWQELFSCTTETFTLFNAYEEAGSPLGGINNYRFYFRSLAKDNAGNWEVKTTYDTNTTIFIPGLAELYVIDQFGNIIRDRGKTGADRNVSITLMNMTRDLLNMTINYRVYHPRFEPGTWDTLTCLLDNMCVVTLGPYPNDTKIDYYSYTLNSYTSETERNPPSGYYSLTMYEHPLANFEAESVMPMIGKFNTLDVAVRNIQLKFDTVHLKLEPSNAIFAINNQPEADIDLNPQEERKIKVRILYTEQLRYNVTVTASSFVDSDLKDKDSVWVTTVFVPEFPGLSPIAVVFLLILAALIYLKFARIENKYY